MKINCELDRIEMLADEHCLVRVRFSNPEPQIAEEDIRLIDCRMDFTVSGVLVESLTGSQLLASVLEYWNALGSRIAGNCWPDLRAK